jgi:hypothetical protein
VRFLSHGQHGSNDPRIDPKPLCLLTLLPATVFAEPRVPPRVSADDQTAQNSVSAQFSGVKEALMRDRAVQKHESACSSAKDAIPGRISSHATCPARDSTNP